MEKIDHYFNSNSLKIRGPIRKATPSNLAASRNIHVAMCFYCFICFVLSGQQLYSFVCDFELLWFFLDLEMVRSGVWRRLMFFLFILSVVIPLCGIVIWTQVTPSFLRLIVVYKIVIEFDGLCIVLYDIFILSFDL